VGSGQDPANAVEPLLVVAHQHPLTILDGNPHAGNSELARRIKQDEDGNYQIPFLGLRTSFICSEIFHRYPQRPCHKPGAGRRLGVGRGFLIHNFQSHQLHLIGRIIGTIRNVQAASQVNLVSIGQFRGKDQFGEVPS
jgi:hypothetical protein